MLHFSFIFSIATVCSNSLSLYCENLVLRLLYSLDFDEIHVISVHLFTETFWP